MKDSIGNEIREGDLVALQLQMPIIRGRVIEIKHGGIVTGMKGGKEQLRPSVVIISATFPIEVDPRAAVVMPVMCLRDDDAPASPEEKPREDQTLPN